MKLGNMEMLYAHEQTRVLLMDDPIDEGAESSMEYYERGWTFFESEAARLKKSSTFAHRSTARENLPPLTPRDFCDELAKKTFTSKCGQPTPLYGTGLRS